MQIGSKKKVTLKQKKLQLAAQEISSALSLFENPSDCSLSYKDLLKTVAHHPHLVYALLDADIQDFDEKQSITLLMDGLDLTLLGSVHESVMRHIIDNHASLLQGADLLKAAQMYPNLSGRIFTDKTLCDKLSGRQLAEFGALDPIIARTIKETKALFDKITINSGVDELAANYLEQKEAGHMSELEYRLKIRHLEKEDKTYMHVGILCQNNPELAQEFVDEGFLDKLNGEDLSYFIQYHPAIIDRVIQSIKLSENLEGNDYRRIGLGSEAAAHKILESKDMMEKAGPHVWAELSAKYPFFFKAFMTTYDMAIRNYVEKMELHQANPAKHEKPAKSELMRMSGEFLIEIAKQKGPKFAEYLYEQAVVHKNPVYRYVFELDGPHDLIDVDKVVESILTQAKQQKGITKEEVQLQVGLAAAGILARNEQLKQRKDIYMSTLVGLSEKLGLKAIDDIISHPKQLDEINPAGIRAMCGNHPRVALKVLDSPSLTKLLTSAQLTELAGIHPKVMAKIWSMPELKNKIIEHFAIPRLTGKSLPILIEAAQNRGFLDQIFAAAKKAKTSPADEDKDKVHGKDEQEDVVEHKEAMPEDVPKGYTWYLYNVLYPRAEVVKTIQTVMKESLSAKSGAVNDEGLNSAQLIPLFKAQEAQEPVPESLRLSELEAADIQSKLSRLSV